MVIDFQPATARPSRRGAQAKKAKTGKRNGRKRQKKTRQSNRKNGDRKNGDSKLSPPEDDSYIRNRTLEETENLPSLGSFSDREDNDCTMEEPEDTAADREEEGAREGNPARTEEENVTRGNIASEMEEEEVTRGDNAAEMEEEEVTHGRKEQVTVKPPPHNAKGNGRNDLAKSSNNDNTSARKPAQKRRPRRKRKPWNPRPRKTPSVRNKANARPEPDLRLQHQKVQPEQNAVINKSSHEPVENPGHPRTQANAPPTTHKRKIEDEVIYSMDHFYQGNILMRVVEGSCGRRVYPIVHPHCLRPVARNQPHIYEVERDPYRMYCYCQSTADGGMIGCDGQNCPHGGWIHYRCAGIRSYTPRGRWYCASCRPYYHDRGKPIYTCQEEIPIAIVKGEPPAEGIYGKGPSIKKQ
ncbi:unnamed protein product [Haemonchus placei]|uniref:PHD domain-containing protein n=1 Tax=Haemonchus placei TaxID=6290 RepID=A0A0N4X7T4_HAEPC|nr:unnamed protein product [Haemonchus placei]